MSTSKTSLVSVVLAAGALGLVWAVRRGPAAGVAATWAAVVGLMLIGAVIFFASDVVFGLLGKDATLTGRTQIWAAIMRQIDQRPWLGYGYAAIWDEPTGQWGPLAWIVHDAGFRAAPRPQRLAGAMAGASACRASRPGPACSCRRWSPTSWPSTATRAPTWRCRSSWSSR